MRLRSLLACCAAALLAPAPPPAYADHPPVVYEATFELDFGCTGAVGGYQCVGDGRLDGVLRTVAGDAELLFSHGVPARATGANGVLTHVEVQHELNLSFRGYRQFLVFVSPPTSWVYATYDHEPWFEDRPGLGSAASDPVLAPGGGSYAMRVTGEVRFTLLGIGTRPTRVSRCASTMGWSCSS